MTTIEMAPDASPARTTGGAGAGKHSWLDRVFFWLTEVPAALLVIAEIIIMSMGVFCRYVLNRPIVWSDELASGLFLWLAMLGSVIALRRVEHMRLTAIAQSFPRSWQTWVETLAQLIVLVFVVEIILPAREYITDQWEVLTPALRIHDSFRVAAIPVGVALMLLASVARLYESSSLRDVVSALMFVAAVAIGLWFAQPILRSMGTYNLIIFFVVLVGFCVALGVPIAFAFGISTLSYLALMTNAPLTIVLSRMDEGMSELILLAIPLFIFLGLLIEMTGLARALVEFMAALIGHIRGGLSYVLLGAMFLVSGISGSKAADMAAVVPVLFPEMKKRGAKPKELIALLAASGAMSETIPPSIVLITIGSVTGTSIAALFTGGLLPALICALALVIFTYFCSRNDSLEGIVRAPFSTVRKTLLIAIPALALPVLIRAAVVEGVATATEVSTVGIAYAVISGLLVYRQFDVRRLYPMLVATASLSGAILLIVGLATAMAWALTQSGFSQSLATTMAGVPGGRAGFLAISIVAFAVLGSVLEGIPAIVLFGPLLFPVARTLGIHEVHYAIVAILSMGLGLFAPPFGVGYYFSCAIGGVSPDVAMARVWTYLGILLIAVIVIAAFPWLSIGFL